ncbi:PAS domain-containing protein [Streptomyces sp. BK022]|uniref:SpoIIE family protein phosphatase n=1 Tax=Streptomyces sp. BK022 TaxID=2512123 RepID=UPI0010E542A9|nr:SpoIIE family protein phosphatase [Streptomyces sp. BK022]RZU36474.1 PAS domain-containing protein [Streptomyces sp. BK022]
MQPSVSADRPPAGHPEGVPSGRVGRAEWGLLTDEADWSVELYRILGLDPSVPALTLDELPALVHEEDRPRLTAMVTGCLVDARPIDGEFRVRRPDDSVRTVHMRGEPVLGTDGDAVSMWALIRDVSELAPRGRSSSTTPEPPARRPPLQAPPGLDLAAHHTAGAPPLTAAAGWWDVLELPGGTTLLSLGDLTGPDPATLLGAVHGLALAGIPPAQLLAILDQLKTTTSLRHAVCCRYEPQNRNFTWAGSGRPVPLLFRDGAGRRLTAPDDPPPGAGSPYGQAELTLRPHDVIVLHTERLSEPDVARLLGLGPRLRTARTARECVRLLAGEPAAGQHGDACLLVARVSG